MIDTGENSAIAGKADWAYAASYQNHRERAAALAPWLDYYNRRRPHSALGHKPPASRVTQTD